MNLASESALLLMAYADGELEEAERARAELLIARESTASLFVSQVIDLGEYVRIGYEAGGDGRLAEIDIVDAVMRMAISGDTESTLPMPAQPLTAERIKRIGPLPTASKRKAIIGAAAALALAASVLVFARKRTEELPMGNLYVTTSPLSPRQQTPSVATGVNSGLGIDVSTVNSSSNAVSVFYFPSANELSTNVVLWVDETGEK